MKKISIYMVIALLLGISQSAIGKNKKQQQKDANIAKVQRGEDCPRCDLSGGDFSNRDLTEINLSGSNLNRAKFKNSKLARANLSKTQLIDVNFDGADLTDIDMTGAVKDPISRGVLQAGNAGKVVGNIKSRS